MTGKRLYESIYSLKNYISIQPEDIRPKRLLALYTITVEDNDRSEGELDKECEKGKTKNIHNIKQINDYE